MANSPVWLCANENMLQERVGYSDRDMYNLTSDILADLELTFTEKILYRFLKKKIFVYFKFTFLYCLFTCRRAKPVLLLWWRWGVWGLWAGNGCQRLWPLHSPWFPWPVGLHCGSFPWGEALLLWWRDCWIPCCYKGKGTHTRSHIYSVYFSIIWSS